MIRLALRACWVAILAAHLWPLFKVASTLLTAPGDVEGWWSLAGLAAAMAFFAAKALDVRWLRVSSAPMGAVLFLVACGIVHGDRAVEDHSAAAAIAITTSAAAGVLVVRQRRRLAEFLDGLARPGLLLLAEPAPAYVQPERRRPLGRDCRIASAPPRGPPAPFLG